MPKKDVLNVQMLFAGTANAVEMKKVIYEIKGYNYKNYINFAGGSYSWKNIEEPALRKLLIDKIKKSTKILDAGCGEGRTIKLSLSLGAMPKNITGIDLSQELLNKVKEEMPEIKTLRVDLSQKNEKIGKESFDLIISNMVLDYLDDKRFDSALKNFFGWLKDGGSLVFQLSHPVREVSKIDDLSRYFQRKMWMDETPWGDKTEYNHRPVSDYVNALIRSGFCIETLLEPEIIKAGLNDSKNYKKYKNGPSRLLIMAKKCR
jgi:trans-aconitate methyltransferase